MSTQEETAAMRSTTKSQTVLDNGKSSQLGKLSFNDYSRQRYVKCNSIEPSELVRKDNFGTEIKRGGRKHKVTFVDKILMNKGEEGKIAEEILVENFKQFNANNVYPERFYSKGTLAICCEACSII